MKNSKTVSLKALKLLRGKIDSVDERLLRVLVLRSKIVSKIGKLKAELGLPILQKSRKKQIQRERQKFGVSIGLDPFYVDQIFNLIHQEAVRNQKTLRKNNSTTSKKLKGKK